PRYEAAAAYLHERPGDAEIAARLYGQAARAATNQAEHDHLRRQAARLTTAARTIVHAAHSACDRTTVRSAGVVRGNWRLPGVFEVFLAVHLLQHREATSCADEGEGGGPDAEPPPRQLGTGVRALSGRGRGRGLARDGTGGTGT